MAYNGLQKIHTVRADGMGHNTPYTVITTKSTCGVNKANC